jgi:hypothetical protein
MVREGADVREAKRRDGNDRGTSVGAGALIPSDRSPFTYMIVRAVGAISAEHCSRLYFVAHREGDLMCREAEAILSAYNRVLLCGGMHFRSIR